MYRRSTAGILRDIYSHSNKRAQISCSSPSCHPAQLSGIADTLRLFKATLAKTKEDRRTLFVSVDELQRCAEQVESCLSNSVAQGHGLFSRWQMLSAHTAHLRDLCLAFTEERGEVDSELMAWAAALDGDVRSILRDIDVLLPWLKSESTAIDNDARTDERVSRAANRGNDGSKSPGVL